MKQLLTSQGIRVCTCTYICSNSYSCIEVYSYSCLHPLSNERKSMFKSGDSRAVWTWVWTWKYFKWALHYLHEVIWKALRTRLIISPIFLFAKRLHTVMTLWRRYDVRKYTADAILFGEIQCEKIDNLMFQQRFQCAFGWNKVKYARITITHVCFIALTLAGSLGRFWTLGLSASCSNSKNSCWSFTLLRPPSLILKGKPICIYCHASHYSNS